jgi:hypothetical protein
MFTPLKIPIKPGSVNPEDLRAYLNANVKAENLTVKKWGKKNVWLRVSPVAGAIVMVRKNCIQLQPYYGSVGMMILMMLGMLLTGVVVFLLIYYLVLIPRQQEFLDKYVTPVVQQYVLAHPGVK